MTINLASTQETIRRITTSRLSIMLHSRFQDSLSCSKTLSQKTKTKPKKAKKKILKCRLE